MFTTSPSGIPMTVSRDSTSSESTSRARRPVSTIRSRRSSDGGAPGAARACSAWRRMRVRGVRSSCAALAANSSSRFMLWRSRSQTSRNELSSSAISRTSEGAATGISPRGRRATIRSLNWRIGRVTRRPTRRPMPIARARQTGVEKSRDHPKIRNASSPRARGEATRSIRPPERGRVSISQSCRTPALDPPGGPRGVTGVSAGRSGGLAAIRVESRQTSARRPAVTLSRIVSAAAASGEPALSAASRCAAWSRPAANSRREPRSFAIQRPRAISAAVAAPARAVIRVTSSVPRSRRVVKDCAIMSARRPGAS